MTSSTKFQVAIVCILALLLLLRLYSLYFSPELFKSFIDLQAIVMWLKNLGPLAYLGFYLLITLSVLSPVPDSILTIVGAYLFGPFIGGGLSFLGAVTGAMINFSISRRFGRAYIAKHYPKSIERIDKFSHKLGWQSVIVARVVPSVTFDIVSYAAGISIMPARTYFLATSAGMLPQAYLTTALGLSFSNSNPIISIILIVTVIAAVIIFSLFQKATN